MAAGFIDKAKELILSEFTSAVGIANLICVLGLVYLYNARHNLLVNDLKDFKIAWNIDPSQEYLLEFFREERYFSALFLGIIFLVIIGSFFITYRDYRRRVK